MVGDGSTSGGRQQRNTTCMTARPGRVGGGVLLGWGNFFLPLGMDDIKPSILMSKLKHLPPHWVRDARGSNELMVAVAMTRHSRSPSPAEGKIVDKRSSGTNQKVVLLPHPPFTNSKTLATACVNTTIFGGQGPECVWALAPIRKTSKPPGPF